MTATWGEGGVVRARSLDYPKLVVACMTCNGGPCRPRVGAVADALIMATDLVGWSTRLLWDRYEMVKSKKSLACWVTVGPLSGVWGSCRLCATVRLVSSTKPSRGERRGYGT